MSLTMIYPCVLLYHWYWHHTTQQSPMTFYTNRTTFIKSLTQPAPFLLKTKHLSSTQHLPMLPTMPPILIDPVNINKPYWQWHQFLLLTPLCPSLFTQQRWLIGLVIVIGQPTSHILPTMPQKSKSMNNTTTTTNTLSESHNPTIPTNSLQQWNAFYQEFINSTR